MKYRLTANGDKIDLHTHEYDKNGRRWEKTIACNLSLSHADFIVQACNAHTGLIEALTKLGIEAEKRGGVPKKYIDEARAAIARATEG